MSGKSYGHSTALTALKELMAADAALGTASVHAVGKAKYMNLLARRSEQNSELLCH
jgi:hypothetical protein